MYVHSHRGKEREFSVGPGISGGGRVSSDQLEQIRRMEGERVEPQLIGSKDVGSLSGQEHTHDHVWQESLLSTQPIQFPLHLSESLVTCPAFSTVYYIIALCNMPPLRYSVVFWGHQGKNKLT